MAFSVDDEATSADTVHKHKLGFPVGHNADAAAVGAAVGSYANAEPKYLQSTGFVLEPDGAVLTAVYAARSVDWSQTT